MARTVYAQQHDNLDAIAYRYFGVKKGVVEQMLSLNPTLANQPLLSIGTPVILPDLQDITPNTDKTIIQLWD